MGGEAEEDTGGGASRRRQEKRANLERIMKSGIAIQAYMRMALTIMAYLAFTWSTVVLLGGFVSSLQRKDFQCLTVITIVEATSIFNDLESKLKLDIWSMFRVTAGSGLFKQLSYIRLDMALGILSAPLSLLLGPLVYVALNILAMFYVLGPFVSMALSMRRLRERDYIAAASRGEASTANLTPALDFFYIMVLSQGVLHYFMVFFVASGNQSIPLFRMLTDFPHEWGMRLVGEYLEDTREKCARNPGLAEGEGTSLLRYAVGLLDSESQEDYLSGARLLDRLITDGEEDARSIIIRSRPKVQKLLDTLGWTGNDDVAEIRELAARIVANLASGGGVHLAQFPGAIRCVSSLMETTGQPYWNSNRHDRPLSRQAIANALSVPVKTASTTLMRVLTSPRRLRMRREALKELRAARRGENCNELILQGLRIVERLACDPHNCRDICADPGGLLTKITASLYSATLIQEMDMNQPWSDVAASSLGAVHRLIHVAPGEAGARLRRAIASNEQAVANLDGILHLGNQQLLQMRAIEILTELVLDSSVNICNKTRENLVRRQLQIFVLADGGEGEEEAPAPATNPVENKTKKTREDTMAMNKKDKNIKATAGEALSILSNKSEVVSRFIMEEHSDIVDRLIRMLDGKDNIRYRTMSAQILDNLCTHCKECVSKEIKTLLPKVLAQILSIKTKPKTETSDERAISAPGDNEGTRGISSRGDDEEMQRPRHKHKKAALDEASDQENEDDMKELQEALLSLTMVIHDKLISADNFALIVQENAPGGAFVEKLKAIVDDNRRCHPTPVSLRIIKLCAQIAASVIRRNCCTSDQKKEFVDSLCNASKTMANLESCMLFAGTDCGLQKAARPLLSDLEKQLKDLIA